MKNTCPPTLISAVSLVYSGLLTVKSRWESKGAPCDGVMPRVPDIFNPTLRFAVCSDIHNRNDRFREMMKEAYAYAQMAKTYKNLDAVLIAGDFTGSGQYEEMRDFRDALNDSLREGTQPIICIGNHEYFACNRRHETEHGNTEQKFYDLFGMRPDMAYRINGYTFLTASYDASGKHFHGAKKHRFYHDTVKQAVKESPEKPVFVLQHPHPRLTVYGSINWADTETDLIWRRYPNVMNFSGHSHYPMNDPRSVWQGGYTALGTGSLKYFELENELKCGFYGSVPDAAEQFYIVEADEKGSVLVRAYDLYSHSFFGEPLYFDRPAVKNSFRYTYKNRAKCDGAPRFASDARITVSCNEKGQYLVNFPAAEDRFAVHDYKVIIKNRFGKTVCSVSALSDYFLLSRQPKYMSVNVGRCLKKGEVYSLAVYACNSYYKLSAPLKTRWQAET